MLLVALAPARAEVRLEPNGRRILTERAPSPAGVIAPSHATSSPAGVDPHLEPGFPVSTIHLPGTYQGGPSIHVMAVNLDADPELEIVTSAIAQGPVHAWNHDGTPVPGWPVDSNDDVGYFAAGPFLAGGAPGVVITSEYVYVKVVDGAGAALPGWPKQVSSGTCWYAPSVWPRGYGDDATIFFGTNSRAVHAWDLDGVERTGWPTPFLPVGGQGRHTPGFADLDGDGQLDIVYVAEGTTGGQYLFAHRYDGSALPGFPTNFHYGTFAGNPMGYPAMGDLDRDGDLEIVVVPKTTVAIVSHLGVVERQIPLPGPAYYGTAAALANLDADDSLEIVVQSSDHLNVMKPSGTPLPGWPKANGEGWWDGGGGPVIGDIDGDGQLDIVSTLQVAGIGTTGEVRAWRADGTTIAGFPKTLPIGSGGTPAIADIDLDGRNELLVVGSYWDGVSGTYPKLWAYDLHGPDYGPVAWGQFMHDPWHSGNVGFDATVGVPDAAGTPVARVRVFPNIARAGQRVRIDAPVDARVEILDLRGRRLFRAPQPGAIEWTAPAGRAAGAGLVLVRAGGSTAKLWLVR